MFAIELLTELAALRDGTASAGLALIRTYLCHSTDDLLRQRLCLIITVSVILLICIHLVGLVGNIRYLLIIFFALLLNFLEDMFVFKNIFNVENFSIRDIYAVGLDL